MSRMLVVAALVLAMVATVVVLAGCPPKKVPVQTEQDQVKPAPPPDAPAGAPGQAPVGPQAPAPAGGAAAPAPAEGGAAAPAPAEGGAAAPAPAEGGAAAPAPAEGGAPAAGGATKPDGTPATPPAGG